MRSLILIAAVACVCLGGVPCTEYSELTALPCVAGQHVIQGNHLWRANWWVNAAPKAGEPGWTDMGECDAIVPTPPCTAPQWEAKVYDTAGTTVTWNGAHWTNRWWSPPTLTPSTDNGGNWYKLFDCAVDAASTIAPPVTQPITTTTTILLPGTPDAASPTTMTTTTPPTTTATTTTATTATTTTTTTATTATTTTPTTATTATTRPAAVTTTTPPRVTTTSKAGGIWDGGPVGPNGECVWPEYKAQEYCVGSYVTMNGQVYSPGWCTSMPPPNSPWTAVASCNGQIKTKWTLEELMAQVNPEGPEYQQIRDPSSVVTDAADAMAAAKEHQLRTATPEAAVVMEVTAVLPLESIEAITPGNDSTNPENVRRVERLFPESDFDKVFPVRHTSYTYTGFLRAIGAFPAYCGTYKDGRNSDDICKRMLATSFAHFTQEVGANWPALTYGIQDAEHRNAGSDAHFQSGESIPLWKQSLWFLREIGHTETAFTNAYRQCDVSGGNMVWGLNFQCPSNKDYYGRGSKQLSWNYNYGGFSITFFKVSNYLLENPHLVADTWLNFASAVWFAVTPQNPKPAMLHVIDGTFKPNTVDIANGMTNSFASTIDIINGGIECRGGGTQQVKNRIAYYKEFMNFFKLSIDADERLDCAGLPGFQAGSAGAVSTYLDKANSGQECQLVSWQTPWKITTDGDYKRCVDYFFYSHWVSKSTRKVVASYGGPSIY